MDIINELVIAFTGVTISLNISKNIKAILENKLELKRISEYDDKTIVNSKYINDRLREIRLFKETTIDDSNSLLPYINKLKDKVSIDDLNVMYHNIQNVKVVKNKKYLSTTAGCYYFETNEINYNDINALGHEFLHLSSCCYDENNDITLVGFEQIKGQVSIGTALNEGYTELLASRFYNKNGVDVYKNEAKIGRLLELFFDKKEDMQHLYFNCDLVGLIKQLENYSNRKDIINLLVELDNAGNRENLLLLADAYIRFIKIELKLYEWFKNKCKDQNKIQEFYNILCEDKLVYLILNKKVKLENDNLSQEKKI